MLQQLQHWVGHDVFESEKRMRGTPNPYPRGFILNFPLVRHRPPAGRGTLELWIKICLKKIVPRVSHSSSSLEIFRLEHMVYNEIMCTKIKCFRIRNREGVHCYTYTQSLSPLVHSVGVVLLFFAINGWWERVPVSRGTYLEQRDRECGWEMTLSLWIYFLWPSGGRKKRSSPNPARRREPPNSSRPTLCTNIAATRLLLVSVSGGFFPALFFLFRRKIVPSPAQ